jgi:hypothetical protein
MSTKGCLVASPHHRIGATIKVSRAGRSVTCTVVDVPQPSHHRRIIARGIVVELAHETAKYICRSVVDPPKQCIVAVTTVKR